MSPKLHVTAGPPGFQGTPLRETSLGSRCRPSGQRYRSGYVKGKQKNHHGVFLKMQVPVSTLRNSVGWVAAGIGIVTPLCQAAHLDQQQVHAWLLGIQCSEQQCPHHLGA